MIFFRDVMKYSSVILYTSEIHLKKNSEFILTFVRGKVKFFFNFENLRFMKFDIWYWYVEVWNAMKYLSKIWYTHQFPQTKSLTKILNPP